METGNPRDWVRFEKNIVKEVEEAILKGESARQTTSKTAKLIAASVLDECFKINMIAIDQTRSLATSLDFGGNLKQVEHFRRGCDIGMRRLERWRERQMRTIEEGA